jgi:caffeoyl-CoA O-methyltransferase
MMRQKSYANSSTDISHYVQNLLNIREDPLLQQALQYAQKSGTPPLQIFPTDGRHLEVFARSIQAQKIVEIGTLCGYSALCLAKSWSQPGSTSFSSRGKIYTCEQSAHHARVAQEIFKRFHLQEHIEIVEGDACQTLPTLVNKGPFDLVFIDADKINYPFYFDWAIENLRPQGLLIADNVFVFGHIARDPVPPGDLGKLVQAMRSFNNKCVQNPRLVSTFLPTGEGLLLGVKQY